MSDLASLLAQMASRTEPAADPALAAVRLARASIDALILKLGQNIDAKVTAQLAGGLSQLSAGGENFVLKLETPLPVGTAVTIRATPTPSGPPAVTVTPQPAAPAVAAPLSLPAAPTSAPVLPKSALPVATAPQAQLAPLLQPAALPAIPATPTVPTPAPTGRPEVAPSPTPPLATSAPAAAVVPSVQTAPVSAQPPASAPPRMQAANAAPAATPPPAQAATTHVQSAAPQPQPIVPMAQGQGSVPAPAATPTSTPVPTALAQPAQIAVAPATPAAAPSPLPAASIPVVPGSPAASLPATVPAPTVAIATQSQSPAPSRPVAAYAKPAAAPPSTAPPPAAAPAVPLAPASPRPAQLPLQQVLADPVQAVARQASVAPLLAQAAAIVRQPAAAALPNPVLEALVRVMAGRVDLNRAPLDGKALRDAVLRAGTLDTGARQPGDVRTTLLALRSALQSFLGGSKVDAVAPVAHRPPPPMAGEPTRAPQPIPAAPLEEQSPEETARQLLGHTDGALARTKLMQLASSPPEARQPTQAAVPELRFEIPMLLGTETGMLQLVVERDGRNKQTPRERGWRMRFAMSFSAMGEVGADVALLGRAANVSIWAAEPSTADALEAMLPELKPALSGHGLDVAGLRVRRGVPQRRLQSPGQLLDSAR